jgi:hypothetical protein
VVDASAPEPGVCKRIAFASRRSTVFIRRVDSRAIVQRPEEEKCCIDKKNERLRVSRSQPFGVPTGSWVVAAGVGLR